MATPQPITALQPYGMLLYRGPVHPEFFKIAGRKQSSHADFDFEAWIFPGGHVLRFEHATTTLCEVVTDKATELPERGLVTTLPCNGERDFEEIFGDRITFVTSIQTETLSEHLYLGTYQEMLEHGKDPAHLVTTWKETAEHPRAICFWILLSASFPPLERTPEHGPVNFRKAGREVPPHTVHKWKPTLFNPAGCS